MDYTANQRRAIETDSKNLQIIACAGSGKTQVMAARVVHLLKTGRALRENNLPRLSGWCETCDDYDFTASCRNPV